MAQAASVRLDDKAMRALAQLKATGRSQAETASRLVDKEALAAEVAALLAEAELMASLRASG